MPKYSIIVPTYNMDRYLGCCIDSLKKQSFDDFEVLFVDDCSTDNSYQICSSIAMEDCRFRIIQQKCNSGLSSTRNLGMANARGQFIIFVDPDDYVEHGLLEDIDKAIELENTDIITWGMYSNIVYADEHEEIEVMSLNSNEDRVVLEPSKTDWEFFIQRLFFASTCNKVYRTDIVKKNGLLFDIECVDFEDFIFNASYIKYIRSFSIKKTPYYHYRQKIGQTTAVKRAWGKVKPFCVSNKVYNACKCLYDTLKEKHNEYDDLMLYAFKAYMTEIEYQYRSKDIRTYISIVGSLPQNTNYRGMLKYMRQPKLRKLIVLLRMLTCMHCGKTQALLLWLLNKRNIG